MGKNTKPMLTVLVESDKLQQFRDYALSKEVSMGWVVNRLLDRVLSGELDAMGDTVSIGTNREYIENVSTGLTRENVESMIKSSIDNQLISSYREYIEESIKSHIDSLGISSTDTNNIEEITRAFIELSLEPIKESVSKLEADTQSQFETVRDELKAISDRYKTVQAPAAIAKNPTLPRKDKPNADSLPEWVRKDDRRFYSLLVDNSALLDKVADAIDLNPKDNSNLAISLFKLGIHKQDGTALDSSSMSRIKYVVSHLETAPESTLP
jgi:gas vesicle protein